MPRMNVLNAVEREAFDSPPGGCNSRPGTGSLHQVAIEAVAELRSFEDQFRTPRCR